MYVERRINTGFAPSDATGRTNRPPWLIERVCANPGTISRNTDIAAAGEPNSIVFVHHGWLFRYMLMADGRRTVLNFVLPGDLTGAECRFRRPSPVFLTAATDCVVSIVSSGDVWRPRAEWPGLDELLVEFSTREAALLTRQLVRVARMSAYERIGDLLLELLARLRAVGLATENSFNLPLTQPVLADALGLTHVHVNRVLQMMKRDGLIHQHCQRITVPSVRRLQEIVGYDDEFPGPAQRAGSLGVSPRSNGTIDAGGRAARSPDLASQ